MNWKKIRLELASTSDFPAGSVSRGYLIRLPLKEGGTVDEAALARSPRRATVRRFWSSDADESSRIERVDGHLAFRLNGDPQRFLAMDSGKIAVGAELSVIDPDGSRLPFRIASIG